MSEPVTIRPLQGHELPQADQICRLAFGTAAGLPQPHQMFGDAAYMHRWHLTTGTSLAAEYHGQLVGTNFLARWGSLGGFGPLTIHPDYWNQGIASALMAATMDQFAQWQTPTVAFFTSSHSPKHLWFYSKFGFAPACLTTVMEQPVTPTRPPVPVQRYATLTSEQQQQAIESARTLSNTLYAGLDLEAEIQLVQTHNLGETLLLWDDAGLAGLAICHTGPGSEAGSGQCYVKFGAARPGPGVADRFEQLLDACHTFAADRQLQTLVAGVNTSRHDAYQRMLARGFKIRLIGVAMHQPPQRDYCRPDVYALDDRR